MEKPYAGTAALLFYRRKILLMLRDDKPGIPWPNTWATPGGGLEAGENFFDCTERELIEEIGVVPKNLYVLGVSAKGACFSFGVFSDEEYAKITKGEEGQELRFFEFEELATIPLTDTFRGLLENHCEEMKYLFRAQKPLSGTMFGLATWNAPAMKVKQEDS